MENSVFAQSNLVEDAEFQVDSSTVNNDFGSQIYLLETSTKMV